MALVKSYTDSRGNLCPQSYWRIPKFPEVEHLRPDPFAKITVTAWRDQAAFTSGLRALESREIIIKGSQYQSFLSRYTSGETDIMTMAYEVLKSDPFFSGATEV